MKTTIRDIDPGSDDEIALVASRMRQTLVEVLGPERGAQLYSMDWLLDRVRWHLDASRTVARIFLAEGAHGEISGHAIARIEHDDGDLAYGYFSTIFVAPGARNRGVADALIRHTLAWLQSLEVPKIIYNTASNHSKLIRLFERHGFQITHREDAMVQLTKWCR